MEKLEFEAELKEVKAAKSQSNDMVYRLVLVTDDPKVMALGVLDSDVTLDVSMEIHR